MAERKPHISEKKKSQVKAVEKLLKEYPVIGVVDMSTLPCAQLQKIRRGLKDKLKIYMAKKRLISVAIDNAKKDVPGLESLKKHLSGIPALMFTKENPFRIFSIIKKSKSSAAAKPGQAAPKDLIIPAGPTQFGPGPVMGELGAMGIKCGIEGGKIAIKTDFVAAKKGDVIKDKTAALLAKFGIKPMEIGLNVKVIFENGGVVGADVLNIDEKEYLDRITRAASWALNLSVEAAIATKDNINILIAKAFRNAKAVAIEGNVFEKDVIGDVLAKISRQASALKKEINV